jgi:hypothetical protein
MNSEAAPTPRVLLTLVNLPSSAISADHGQTSPASRRCDRADAIIDVAL